MCTRSTIWFKTQEGYKGIYCHCDGYLDGVGKTLYKYYNTEDRVKSLISLGGLSSLHKHIAPPKNVKHNFYNPTKDVTIAYHRDRGEELEVYQVSNFEELGAYKEEFNYIFIDGEWYYFKVGEYDWYLKHQDRLPKIEESILLEG